MLVIDEFKGPFWFLSNFYESPITFNGFVWPSVEHAYQACKTIDVLEQDRIRFAETPGRAKRLGAQSTLRGDWDDIKIEVMDQLLRLKFMGAEHGLTKALALTYPYMLVEGNTWGDTFWGKDLKTGEGLNHLGQLLMQIRSEIVFDITD